MTTATMDIHAEERTERYDIIVEADAVQRLRGERRLGSYELGDDPPIGLPPAHRTAGARSGHLRPDRMPAGGPTWRSVPRVTDHPPRGMP